MSETPWQSEFRKLWERGAQAWHAGQTTPATMFSDSDAAFLQTIGCSTQELFDFIDDSQHYGEPDMETALQVTAIRRRYFFDVMDGKPSGKTVPTRTLPAKSDEVDGIAWLPRIIEKARLKLRGEMEPDLMYGCGGDRPFLRSMNMTLPQFLQLVWDSGEDDRRIVDSVKQQRDRTGPSA